MYQQDLKPNSMDLDLNLDLDLDTLLRVPDSDDPAHSLSVSSPSYYSSDFLSPTVSHQQTLAPSSSPVDDTSLSIQSFLTPYDSDPQGLCPQADSPLFSVHTSYSADVQSPPSLRIRRKSKDIDAYLGFSYPLRPDPSAQRKRQSYQAPQAPARIKFVDRLNIFKSKPRKTNRAQSVQVGLHKQASSSTSALSAFDFGFDKPTSQEKDDTRSLHPNNDVDELDEMGLMRSLTTRVKRIESEDFNVMRSLTRKRPETPLEAIQAKQIKGRPTISLPTQLLSTTNMASYNAPSVEDMRALARQQASGIASSPLSQIDNNDRPVSPSGSQRSSDRMSDMSEPSLTDASSISSRSSQDLPTPMSTPERKRLGTSMPVSPSSTICSEDLDAPAIPRRAPSHSKREHVRLARHRSVRSSLRAASLQLEAMNIGVVDTAMGPMAPASVILSGAQPFSQELAQLTEAVEEFASSAAARDEEIEAAAASVDEDSAYLASKGLAKFSVDDYLLEIQPLSFGLFSEVAIAA